MPRPSRIPAAVAAAGLLLAAPVAPPTRAQEEAPTSLFVEQLEVSVVNVEAWVTDERGNPVVGLTPEDFEVLEDGRPVEVTNFYSVARADRVLERLEQDRAMVLGEPLPPPRDLPQDQQLNLLIYVDHVNIRPQNRKRVLDQLAGFLEDRITQGDQVMLVGYDRTIDVIQTFTDERRLIADGLRRLGKAAAHLPMDDARRRLTVRNMNTAASMQDIPLAYEFLRSYVQNSRDDLRRSTRALESVVRALAGLPGRKALLYVSDGLPQRPGEDLYQQFLDLFGQSTLLEAGQAVGGESTLFDPSSEALQEDESHLFNRITREANAHQVTFYTLDARGPQGGSTLPAENAAIEAGSAGHATADALRTMNLQEPLITMAERTGGRSLLNTYNVEEALGAVASDFDSFYSLGYRPPHGGDGRYHEITVRVKHPGFRVRHRVGYVDKPQGERVADRTLSSLILDLEKNPHGVQLDFGEPTEQGRGKYVLPILVRVPFSEVTLLPADGGHEGRLKFFVVVQDPEGGVSDLHEKPYPVTVPNDLLADSRGRELGYAASLRVRKGRAKIAVGVWDELSGAESFVLKQVVVGARR